MMSEIDIDPAPLAEQTPLMDIDKTVRSEYTRSQDPNRV